MCRSAPLGSRPASLDCPVVPLRPQEERRTREKRGIQLCGGPLRRAVRPVLGRVLSQAHTVVLPGWTPTSWGRGAVWRIRTPVCCGVVSASHRRGAVP